MVLKLEDPGGGSPFLREASLPIRKWRNTMENISPPRRVDGLNSSSSLNFLWRAPIINVLHEF